MSVFLFLLLFPVLAKCGDSSLAKRVNLALETVLEFDKHNLDSDVQIIDNVQKFLTKVRNVLDANRVETRRKQPEPKEVSFTDFIVSCIDHIKGFDDDHLKEFAIGFDEEIRKYHYRGCKFYELLENSRSRQYIGKKLQQFRSAKPKKMRKLLTKLQKKIKSDNKTEKERDLMEFFNSLYKLNSQAMFKEVTDNFEGYKMKSKRGFSNGEEVPDLLGMIKDAVQAIFFNHYSNLSPNVRNDVRIRVAGFLMPEGEDIADEVTTKKWDSAYMKAFSDDDENLNLRNQGDEEKFLVDLKIKMGDEEDAAGIADQPLASEERQKPMPKPAKIKLSRPHTDYSQLASKFLETLGSSISEKPPSDTTAKKKLKKKRKKKKKRKNKKTTTLEMANPTTSAEQINDFLYKTTAVMNRKKARKKNLRTYKDIFIPDTNMEESEESPKPKEDVSVTNPTTSDSERAANVAILNKRYRKRRNKMLVSDKSEEHSDADVKGLSIEEEMPKHHFRKFLDEATVHTTTMIDSDIGRLHRLKAELKDLHNFETEFGSKLSTIKDTEVKESNSESSEESSKDSNSKIAILRTAPIASDSSDIDSSEKREKDLDLAAIYDLNTKHDKSVGVESNTTLTVHVSEESIEDRPIENRTENEIEKSGSGEKKEDSSPEKSLDTVKTDTTEDKTKESVEKSGNDEPKKGHMSLESFLNSVKSGTTDDKPKETENKGSDEVKKDDTSLEKSPEETKTETPKDEGDVTKDTGVEMDNTANDKLKKDETSSEALPGATKTETVDKKPKDTGHEADNDDKIKRADTSSETSSNAAKTETLDIKSKDSTEKGDKGKLLKEDMSVETPADAAKTETIDDKPKDSLENSGNDKVKKSDMSLKSFLKAIKSEAADDKPKESENNGHDKMKTDDTSLKISQDVIKSENTEAAKEALTSDNATTVLDTIVEFFTSKTFTSSATTDDLELIDNIIQTSTKSEVKIKEQNDLNKENEKINVRSKDEGNGTTTDSKVDVLPEIVDVISVLNSTLTTQEKLAKLQTLRKQIDLIHDEDNKVSSD